MCNDDWSEVVWEVMKSCAWSAYLIVLFLVYVCFMLLNVFNAMFVRGMFLMGERDFDEETQFDEGRAFQEIKLNMDATTKQTRRMIKSQKKATDETHDLAHQIE